MSKTPTLVRESSSVDESLTQEDARRFWKQHFGEVEKSSWETFAAALSREFVFAKSDIDRIKEGMDTDGDGTITLEEFNDFTLKDGLARALQKLMHAPTLPPKRSRHASQSAPDVPWLADVPRAKISTWQPGRDQQGTKVAAAELKVAGFAMLLVAFVHFVLTFEGAKEWMAWIESLKVCYGLISFLDFCGSTMTCFNYRLEAQRLLKAGDERLLLLHRTFVGFYAQSMLKCNFLQFGGTTVTALLLGQPPSWLAGTHVWTAFLLAYWLVFCSPGDVWFRLLNQGALVVPIKTFATVSAGHALSSWGVEKALTCEHPKIRSSVWGALACGFASGCLGGMVAGVAEEGEGWLSTKAPTWPQQRTFYLVIIFYVMTDPHGSLHNTHQSACLLAGVPATPVFPIMSSIATKVSIVMAMLVLQFSLDFAGLDLLLPLNKLLARVFTTFFPIQMDRNPIATELTATKQLEDKAKKRD